MAVENFVPHVMLVGGIGILVAVVLQYATANAFHRVWRVGRHWQYVIVGSRKLTDSNSSSNSQVKMPHTDNIYPPTRHDGMHYL